VRLFHRSSAIACALCAALLFLAACDSPKEKEAKYLASGKTLFESGDLVKARLQFKNVLQINPVNADAEYYLGLIAEKQGDLSNASIAFKKAADAAPNNFDANLKAAQLSLMGGDADAAASYAERLRTIKPDRPEGHTVGAAVLLMQNQLPAAEKEARAALAVDPKSVDAAVVLAARQSRDGQNDDALATVADALKLNPQSTDLLLVRLKLVNDQGRKDDVIAVLQQLHDLQPDNANFAIDLANQLASTGKLPEAENVFKQALAQSKNPEGLVAAYASFLSAREGTDQAIQEIKGLIDSKKLPQKYMLLLEALYLKAGKVDDAAALMTTLRDTAEQPENRLNAQVELARIAEIRKNRADALAQLEAVLKEDGENEGALLLRGAIMLSDGKFDGAMADARSVLKKDINSIGGLSILARAYAATGNAQLAIQTLQNLIRIAPTDVDARLQLASLLAGKSSSAAIDQLDAAIALRPDARELLVQKAQYLIQTGDPSKAEMIGQSLIADPKHTGDGHLIVAEASLARGDHATAITELKAAEAAGVPFTAVGPVLMNAYVKAGRVADAEQVLNQRIAANANDATAMSLLATLQARTGRSDAAAEQLQRAIAAQPDNPDLYLSLAQLYTQTKRLKEAAALLQDAEKRFPGNDKVTLFSAMALDTAGDFDAARAGYEKVLATNPANTVAANNLAALIADVWAKDATLLGRARQLAEPFRSSDQAAMMDTLGWVQTRLGNFDDATILLARATSLEPDNQQMQFHYALALSGKGLLAKAKDAVAKATSGTPDYRGLDEATALAKKLN
jgi:pentatricopeptide repeat protein